MASSGVMVLRSMPQLRGIDLNTITPLEAMRLLFELQQKARG